MSISRRSFLKGTAALFAAPAIVKAEILMPVKQPIWQPTGFVPGAIYENPRAAGLTIDGLPIGAKALIMQESNEPIIRVADENGIAFFEQNSLEIAPAFIRIRKPGYLPIAMDGLTPVNSPRISLDMQIDEVYQ